MVSNRVQMDPFPSVYVSLHFVSTLTYMQRNMNQFYVNHGVIQLWPDVTCHRILLLTPSVPEFLLVEWILRNISHS